MRIFRKTVVAQTLMALIFLAISCQNSENIDSRVRLSGKLVNWGNASKILNDRSLASDFGLGNDQLIHTNEEGQFSLSFELNEPGYFSLGRNKLYLSPGDELYLEVDYRDPEAAVFNGASATLQAYLSGVPFPKSGSYLEGGRNLQSANVSETWALAKAKTEERRRALQELEATEEFMELESMRLTLDQLNTILSMPIYGSFKDFWEYSEKKKAELLVPLKDEINSLAAGLMQDKYMKHPNFRDMLLELVDPALQQVGIFAELTFTPYMIEYDKMGAWSTQLELAGLTEEMEQETNQLLASNIAEDYKAMIQTKLQSYEALNPGKPAFDVVLTNALGEQVNLSSFKGELIYVDLWATWCGPCIAEFPAFEELKNDYANDPIAFVPVSIDTDLEAWQQYLEKHQLEKDKEYAINRLDLADYKVITIPRYLLLDSSFQIISVFAPKPSDPQTRLLLDSYLKAKP